jgi:cyclophilin family peptidyl-prolyl cis-trans isomerase
MMTLLFGCGSGGDTPLPPPNVQANNLFYGVEARFFVGVTQLNSGVTFSASHCGAMNPTASSNPLYQAFTCTVNATGNLDFIAKDEKGQVLLSKSFDVPLPQVSMVTNQGTVLFELNPSAAPLSVNNFLQYVSDGFYNGTLFHRVIPGFVVQAGGFTTGLTPKSPTYNPIPLESQNNLSNNMGTLAMARTSDPNSATSQFYVNLVDNTSLNYKDAANPGYAVFGSVISGMDVINAIASVPTTTLNSYSNVPLNEITITSMTRIK